MKKTLMAFYVKVALAVGVPVLCVAVAVAINSNKEEVCQNEISIIETASGNVVPTQSDEIKLETQNKTGTVNEMQVKPISTESASTKPVPIESTTPTAPIESEPIEFTPTLPEPTEPIPTEPIPTQPQPTTENDPSGEYEVKYTYDLLGRLIRAEYEFYIMDYVYDKNGNILEVKKTLK